MTHWIRSRGSKWHGWEEGAHWTLCGRVTVLHLHNGERLDIDDSMGTAEHHAELCVECRRKAAVPPPQSADEVARGWEHYIRTAVQLSARGRRGPRDADVQTLATALAEGWTPGSPVGEQAWRAVQALFLLPWEVRAKDFGAAVAVLTTKEKALARVLLAVTTWQKVTGRALGVDRYHAGRVVEVMLAVPDPEPYVRHLKSRGLEHLAAVFHPNTLARALKEPALRGTFAGGSAYWDDTAHQLTIVE